MANTQYPILTCNGVRVFVDDIEIVKGFDINIKPGEVHAIMGPNGSGKSTLAAALAGHPAYRVEGDILLDGQPLNTLAPDERARLGFFLGFQYPIAVPGVSVSNFLRAAVEATTGEKQSVFDFTERLRKEFDNLEIPWEFASRYLNDGFSGGEKKRLEILQMLMLEPRLALLDEVDSGLDIDALKIASTGINRVSQNGKAVLLVTHYQRILNHVKPDKVHVFVDGHIIRTGGPSLALELEDRGYERLDSPPELTTGGHP